MAPLDRIFGKLSKSLPWVFYASFSTIGYATKWLPPPYFIRSLESSMSESDKTLLADREMARFFAEDIKEAFRQGVRGPADDAILLYRDWGFRVTEISMAVHLFHGENDQFAPVCFARYLDEKLPLSHLHVYPEEGHLSMMKTFDQVFEQVSW